MGMATPKQQQILKEGLELEYIGIETYENALRDSKVAYQVVGEIFQAHNQAQKQAQVQLLRMFSREMYFSDSVSNWESDFFSESDYLFMPGIYCADDM